MGEIRFQPDPQASIPCLSWCARWRQGEPAIRLCHGRGVEAEETNFFEGAWSSELAGRDFAGALFFAGSGGRITAEGPQFATSTHTLAALFLLRQGKEIIVSNSLVFLLMQAGDDLDPKYKFYTYDLGSIMEGLRHYVPSIPTRGGRRVEIYYFCNVQINGQGEVRRQEKPLPPAFSSYADYYAFLEAQVRAVAANASDGQRRIRYEPISTISSGYDSAVASFLAQKVGCRQVITFPQSRGMGPDSGREVAERLGLEVLEFDREEYRKHEGSEVDFLATGTGGEDMVMAPLADLFAGKLVFTGFYGLIWDRVNEEAGPDLLKSDASGCSLEEFRLQAGFIHLPVPYIGCRRHLDLMRISSSSELAPWCTGNDSYDKPIPRRILEEGGIPGRLFGQKKRGATQPFFTVCRDDPPPEEVLSAKSLAEFRQYAEETDFYSSPIERAWLFFMWQLSRFNRFVLRAGRQFGLCQHSKLVVPLRYRKRISRRHLIFPWAVNKVKERYQVAAGARRET